MSQNVPENENKESPLSPRQQKALPIIAASASLSAAARQAKVNRKTLARWLEDDQFREELDQLRDEAAEFACRELQRLMLNSVNVLDQAMKDPNPAIRVRAANSALAFAIKVGENRKLNEQLQSLELALPIWAAQRLQP